MKKYVAKPKTTEPAKHLSRESKALWRKIVREWSIDDPAGLKVLDVGLEALDRATKARMMIEKDGMIVRDRFGQKKPHPLLATERDARAQFMQAVKSLNLDVEPLNATPGRPAGS